MFLVKDADENTWILCIWTERWQWQSRAEQSRAERFKQQSRDRLVSSRCRNRSLPLLRWHEPDYSATSSINRIQKVNVNTHSHTRHHVHTRTHKKKHTHPNSLYPQQNDTMTEIRDIFPVCAGDKENKLLYLPIIILMKILWKCFILKMEVPFVA